MAKKETEELEEPTLEDLEEEDIEEIETPPEEEEKIFHKNTLKIYLKVGTFLLYTFQLHQLMNSITL